MKQIRKRLTYANVMSSIAVFLILGGATAFAAAQLGKNTVGAKQLKANAVTATKIQKGAVTQDKISSRAQAALKGAQGSVGPTGPQGDAGTPATKLWAVLNGSGTLVRGSGVTSTTHPGLGRQAVVFNQDVSGCAFFASPGSTSTTDGVGSYPSPGMAAVGPLSGNSHGIVVSRALDNGNLVDFPVYVAVLC